MPPAILQQLDNFYLTDSDLEDTPSRRDGVDAETEKRLLFYGCQRIQRAVVLLRVPQVVAATAQTLLHRFYCKKSLCYWHIRKLTVAVTWIAIKIEEQTKLAWLTDVTMVFHVLQQREDGKRSITLVNPEDEEFVKLKSEICSRFEMGVFDALGFICHVDHPHKLTSNIPGLIFYDKEMKRDEIPEGLLQEAWSLANDSLQTPLCVRFRSLTIACACVFLAARRLSIAMPEDPPWWEFAGATFQDIVTVCKEILSVHQLPPPVYISVNKGETAATVDKKLVEQSTPQQSPSKVAPGGGDAAPRKEGAELPGPPPPPTAAASVPSSSHRSDAAVVSDQSPAQSTEPSNSNRSRPHSRQGHGQSGLGRSDRVSGGRENRRHRDGGPSRQDRNGSPRSGPGPPRKPPGSRAKDRSHPNDSARKDGYRDRFGAGSDDETAGSSPPRGQARHNGSQGGERHDSGGNRPARDSRPRRDDRRDDWDSRGDPDRRYRESDAARRKRDDGGAQPRFREPDSRGSTRNGARQNSRDGGPSSGDVRQNNGSSRKPLDWDEMSRGAAQDRDGGARPQKRSPGARGSGEEIRDRAPKVHRSEART